MTFIITGQIRELESGIGVPNLRIEAWDKDLIFDDKLGECLTDAEGQFKLSYTEEDFQDLFEKRPDIYLKVFAPNGIQLHSTEKSVRCEAGREEHFEIELPRQLLGQFYPEGENTMSDIYTIEVRILGGDAPLANYRIVAHATFIVTILIKVDPDKPGPGKLMSAEEIVDLGETYTGTDGRFSLPFDLDEIKPVVPEGRVSKLPKVTIQVFEPDSAVRVAVRRREKPTFKTYAFGDISVASVSVVDWQLHYPAGASNFILGDILVLTANVRNTTGREVTNLGLRASLTPLCFDDSNAHSRRDSVEPYVVEVITDIVLDPAGTPQTGDMVFDPSPLDMKPIALAIQIPRELTAVGATPLGGDYTFAPAGLFRIEAELLVGNTVPGTAIFDVCVLHVRDQPLTQPHCTCSGAVQLRSFAVGARTVFIESKPLIPCETNEPREPKKADCRE